MQDSSLSSFSCCQEESILHCPAVDADDIMAPKVIELLEFFHLDIYPKVFL